VLVTLQGDDIFLHDLPASHLEQCRALLGRLDDHVDGYITNSHFYADFMHSDLNLSLEKFHIAPLCIDVTELTRPAQPATAESDATSESGETADSSRPLCIGYLARLAPEKGLHVLADAFIRLCQNPELSERLADRELMLRIAGWLGPQNKEYVEGVFEKLRAAGLGDRFEYVGEIDRAEKVAFLHSLDVLSVPTVYKEPKGLFVLEALAAGVPVVQPEHGAFPELLEATGGGVLFRPEDDKDLALKLSEILVDPRRRRELSDHGCRIVTDERNANTMASRAVELYRQFGARLITAQENDS
jgi:glycosyltransferase involved in cell wall biosynthesis